MDRKLLNMREAAILLSLGRSSLYTLVATGQIRSVKIGRSRRIPADAIDEFVARLLAQETSDASVGRR